MTGRIKKKNRGMSVVHDLIDWIGGYPLNIRSQRRFLFFLKKKALFLIILKQMLVGMVVMNMFLLKINFQKFIF